MRGHRLERRRVVLRDVRLEPLRGLRRRVDDQRRLRRLQDDHRVLHGELVSGQALRFPCQHLALAGHEPAQVEALDAQVLGPPRRRRRAPVLRRRREVRDEPRREQRVQRQSLERDVDGDDLFGPSVLLAAEFAEEPFRGFQLVLRFFQVEFQRLRLARATAKLLLHLDNLAVQRLEFALALLHATRGRVQGVGELPEDLLERRDLLQHQRVLDLCLDPRGQRCRRDRDPQDVLVLEQLLLFLEDLPNNLAVLRRHHVRVEVDDLLLHAARPEELLLPRPARVRVVHQKQHGFEDGENTLRRCSERLDLVDVVGLDLADRGSSRVDQGLHVLELVFDASLLDAQVLLFRARLLLETLHLLLAFARGRHAHRDAR